MAIRRQLLLQLAARLRLDRGALGPGAIVGYGVGFAQMGATQRAIVHKLFTNLTQKKYLTFTVKCGIMMGECVGARARGGRTDVRPSPLVDVENSYDLKIETAFKKGVEIVDIPRQNFVKPFVAE